MRIEKEGTLKPNETLEAEFPPAPLEPGVFTEVLTKTTFTETTTTAAAAIIMLLKIMEPV